MQQNISGQVRLLAGAGLPRSSIALVFALVLAACGNSDPASQLADAKKLLEKSDVKAATIQLKNVLQQQADNGEARFLLGEIYLKSLDYPSAEKELRRAFDLKFDPNRVAPQLARTLFELRQFPKVVSDVDPAAITDPTARATVLVYRARALLAQGKMAEAKTVIKEAQRTKSDLSAVMVTTARITAAEQDLPGAIKIVDGAIAAKSDDHEALVLRAEIELAQGRRDGAKQFLERAVAAAPKSVDARAMLATLLLESDKPESARQHVDALKQMEGGGFPALHLLAMLELRQGRYKEAREAAAQVLKVVPDHLPSLAVQGTAEYALGGLAQAETSLRAVIARVPGNVFARKVLAATFVREGKIEEAHETLAPMLRAEVKDPSVYSLAGDIALARNEPEKATEYYTKAKEIGATGADVQTALAIARLRAGDRDRGLAELQAAATLDPTNARADNALIVTHLRARQWDKALEAVAALQKKQPDNPNAWNLAAAAYVGKGDAAKARESLEKAVSVQATFMPAVVNLVQMDLRDKKTDSAKKRLEAVLAKDANNLQALTVLSRVVASSGGKRDEVVALLDRAINGNADSLVPRVAKVRYLLEVSESKQAVTTALDAQTRFPGNPEALDLLGAAQMANNETNQALATYQKLVNENPKLPAAALRLAQAQMAAKDLEAARRTLRSTLDANPRNRDVLSTLVSLEVMSGNFTEALKIAADLQKAEPMGAAGMVLEGDIQFAARKYAAAAAAYRKALAVEKTSSGTMRLLRALNSDARHAEAEAVAAAWFRDNPKDNQIRLYLADARLAAKNYEEAKKHYLTVLAASPNDTHALNNLAWTARITGDPKAREYADRALGIAPGSWAILDTAGLVYADSGDVAKGISLLRDALRLVPANQEIRFHLAQVLVKAGQKEEAKRELEETLKSGRKFAAEQEARDLLSKL